MNRFQIVIGRSENLDIVDIALGVPAKIDTGAFRSSIHACDIKVSQKEGKQTLTCKLLGHPCSPVGRPFTTTEFDKVVITNSFGQEEERYEVILKVKLGPKIFKTSFTLADRSNNLFPILAGRTLLKNRYLIDVAKSSVDRARLKKTFGALSQSDAEDLED
jgi:hypothetical protein